jgi:hypothetical protein
MKRLHQDDDKNDEKRSTTLDSDSKCDAFVTWSSKNNFQMNDKVCIRQSPGKCFDFFSAKQASVSRTSGLFGS